MRETAADKGRRLLTEGRLTILVRDHHGVLAVCRGDGIEHRLGHDSNAGWHCDCEAARHKAACSHLHALRLVVLLNREGIGS